MAQKVQIITRTLSREEMETELPFIAQMFCVVSAEEVSVHYWGGEIKVGLTGLLEAFHEGFEEPAGPFAFRWYLGSSDFTIYNDAFDIEVELCHESHVHVRSSDEAILDKFRLRWRMLGLYPSSV